MRYWCEDCQNVVARSREGVCAACGGGSVVPKVTPVCRICGGGPDEGEMVGSLIHRLCIPAFIRRRGASSVARFLSMVQEVAG